MAWFFVFLLSSALNFIITVSGDLGPKKGNKTGFKFLAQLIQACNMEQKGFFSTGFQMVFNRNSNQTLPIFKIPKIINGFPA